MTPVAPHTVVMTRQPAQAGAVEAGLAAAGYRIAYLPLTDFELPEDSGPLRETVALLNGACPSEARVAWLVLTSPNTVRALAALGWSGRVPGCTRIAVTGPGTARVLAAAGFADRPWMPEADASAAGILEQFPAPGDASSRTLLLPQSALATEEVADGLAARGWDVERLDAYRTVPYPAEPGRRLLAGPHEPDDGGEPITWAVGGGSGRPVVTIEDLAGTDVVLTSPSAVRELARRGGTALAKDTRFLAIGRPTARAAQATGLELAGTAPSPDAEGLLTVLAAL